MKRFKEAVADISEGIFLRFRDRAIDELKEQDKIVSGALADSLKFKVGEENIFYSDDEGVRGVEYGRLPHTARVPLEPLAKWIQDKYGASTGEAWRRAKEVQNRIFEQGIKPSYFLTKAKAKELTT